MLNQYHFEGYNYLMSEMSQQPEKSSEDEPDGQRDHAPEPATPKTPELPKETTRKNWREVATFFISFGYVRDKEGEERLHTKAQLRGGKAEQWRGQPQIN
jgi:hypothetical protein